MRFEKRYNKNATMPTITNPINNFVVEVHLGEGVDIGSMGIAPKFLSDDCETVIIF
jgi:hypothetical protein